MENDALLFAQRSLFKVSNLGFPVDFYETNILLVIINMLVPNAIPGIDNPKEVFENIIYSYILTFGINNLLVKLREICYILHINLFNNRFKTIEEVTSLSPILNEFINHKIRDKSYLPRILFLMNNDTKQINDNLFETIIKNDTMGPSRKYALQFSNKGILNITIDNKVYSPNKSKSTEYEWAKYIIYKTMFTNNNATQHGACGHFLFHNIGYIYKQTLPDTHNLGIFFNYLMGGSYGMVYQTQVSATYKNLGVTDMIFSDLFNNPHIKGNDFSNVGETIKPFEYLNTMFNRNIQYKEFNNVNKLLKIIKKYIFILVETIDKQTQFNNDIYVLQFWRLLHSYYKDIPSELNVENMSYILYSCVLASISHSFFHSDTIDSFFEVNNPCNAELNTTRNILDCLPDKLSLQYIIFVQEQIHNDNSRTLFSNKNVYPNKLNLNKIMNELSDKVTKKINKHKLFYLKHGIIH